MTIITIAPAGPKTATATIRALLEMTANSGTSVQIKAFYRDTAKAPREFSSNSRFQALKGDVEDLSSLDFKGSDAVLNITPPTFDGRDMVAQAEFVSTNVRKAAEAAGSVKQLVLLSSIGAHLSEGVGEIKTNNIAERVLSATKASQTTIARCQYFMENWAQGVETLNNPEPFIFSTITPLDYAFPMVAVEDIGKILARELLKVIEKGTNDSGEMNPYIFEIHGPVISSPLDVQKAFSKALSRDVAIKAVEKGELSNFFSQFMPPSIAAEMVEMTVSFLPGGKMLEQPDPIPRDVVYGETTLDEVIKGIVRKFVADSL